MQILKNKKEYLVGFHLSNNGLNCTCFELINRSFKLYAFKMYPFEHSEINNITIYNYIRLAKFINSFFKNFNISNPKVIFALEGKQLIENISQKEIKYNPIHYFTTFQILKIYNKEYIYSVSIRHESLFQYKLLAYICQLNLIAITTSFNSLYFLFKNFNNIKINNFKPSINFLKKFFIRLFLNTKKYKNFADKELIEKFSEFNIHTNLYNNLISLGLYYVWKAYQRPD